VAIPSFSLEGKVAIVTGGKRGIGKAFAFAEAGADVAVCGRVIEDGELQAVAREIQRLGRRSLAIQADISRKADIDNLVQEVIEQFGTIDILVNNASIIIRTPLIDTTEDDWDKVIDIDLKGYYLCSQAVGKKMMERKKGTIINISSGLGMKVQRNTGAYCIAKAGVLMLTRVLAVELGSYNVRVNAIAPGLVQTEFSVPVWGDLEIRKQRRLMTPLGRLAEASDIVGTTLFLASDASSFVTGVTIVVDGGALA